MPVAVGAGAVPAVVDVVLVPDVVGLVPIALTGVADARTVVESGADAVGCGLSTVTVAAAVAAGLRVGVGAVVPTDGEALAEGVTGAVVPVLWVESGVVVPTDGEALVEGVGAADEEVWPLTEVPNATARATASAGGTTARRKPRVTNLLEPGFISGPSIFLGSP